MGYNLKATYCDLADLDEGGIATVSAIFGKHSLEGQKTKGTNFVDLNLGSLGEVGKGLRNSFKTNRAPLMESFSAGSSKRARAPNSGGQTVSCLVDGCKSDLSKCRDYHRRHKVCEMHSKSPKVTIGGHEQRFCQQCSRFHSLGEFDEGKRSCRKRLEGHNRRRRKPQPEPLPVNHGNYLSASQGNRYLPFSNQAMIPASAVVSTTTWSGGVKSESNPSVFTSSVSGSYSQAYRGSRQFPFLQGTDSPLSLTGASSSSAGHALHHDPSSSSSNSGSNRISSNNNGLINQVMDSNHHHHHHHHRALSLLSSSSSSPAETQTPEMGLGRIIQPSPINPARPIINGLFYNQSVGNFPGGQCLEGQPGNGNSGSALMSNMRSNNSLCQDVFQSGSDGSSATATAAHQTLSFSWE